MSDLEQAARVAAAEIGQMQERYLVLQDEIESVILKYIQPAFDELRQLADSRLKQRWDECGEYRDEIKELEAKLIDQHNQGERELNKLREKLRRVEGERDKLEHHILDLECEAANKDGLLLDEKMESLVAECDRLREALQDCADHPLRAVETAKAALEGKSDE